MAAEDKKKCGECGKWSHGSEACAVCGAGRTSCLSVCQAAAMDFATFLGEGKETVPPCHEPATEEIAGWKLCGGCAETLRWMRECFS